MNTSIFYRGNKFIVLKHTLTKDTAFICNYSAINNTVQSSYIVYTRGTINCSNVDGSFNFSRTSGDTTDTSEAVDIPHHLAFETPDDVAEFFCISKYNYDPVIRSAIKLNNNELHEANSTMVFLAAGTVVVDGNEIAAPNMIELSSTKTIRTKDSSWIIELS